MTHDVFIVQPDTPLTTAVALLRRHRIGSLPVMKNKDLVGIITRSDILDFVLSGNGAGKRAKGPARAAARGQAEEPQPKSPGDASNRGAPHHAVIRYRQPIDLQEIDNAVNITRKAILSRYDFRDSKTEITLDKKEKKIHVTTEDDMKLRAVQDSLIENLVKRKVDRKFLEPKPAEPAAHGMIQREMAIKEGVDSDTARSIVKMIKERKLKVQAAIQENQVRVTGKKIDDLQEVMQLLRASPLPIPLQFINMQR